jgi:hypothetical protein
MAQPTSKAKALDKEIQAEYSAALTRKRELHKHYLEEEKVPMHLSPMYRPYVGNVMNVTINGITIFFKVDGTTQMVPKTFAETIDKRRVLIDNMLKKTEKMADLGNNFEQSPGELKLF